MTNNDYPPLYADADTVSLEAQRRSFRLLRVQLSLLVLSALLGALHAVIPDEIKNTISVTTLLVLVLTLFLTWTRRTQESERIWYDTRAVAESVKSLTWRYMTGAVPYRLSEDPSTVDTWFVEHLREIRRSQPGVEKYLASRASTREAITDAIRKARAKPLEERKGLYLRERLGDQREWYSSKAAASRGAAACWSNAVLGAQLAALVIAITNVATEWIPFSPIPLLMTLAATFVAWAQAQRNDELSEAYAVAAQELSEIGSLADHVTDENLFSEFVDQVEEACSREHTLWTARRNVSIANVARGKRG